jgi:hypothetical protein
MQNMSGLQSLDDGSGGLLQDGVLTCIGVVAEDIQSDNLNVNNSITAGQSIAIGKDIAIGNSVVTSNLYTNKLVSQQLITQTIKTNKINLSNNLQIYDDTNIGFIKKNPEISSKPFLLTNTDLFITSVQLPIGIYMLNYRFDIALSAISLPSLHGITHALSTDNVAGDVSFMKFYGNIEYDNTLSYATVNVTVFHQVKEFNSSVYLLAYHESVTNGVSNIVLKNINMSALRIA